MPSLRHHFHVDWAEIEAMPFAELDEHVWWLEDAAARAEAQARAIRGGR